MSRVTGFHFLCGFQGGQKTSKDGAPVPDAEIETQSALLWGTTPWFLFKITLFVDPFLKVKLLSLLSNYCSTADKPKPQKRRIKLCYFVMPSPQNGQQGFPLQKS
jgi:hypothetical protein